MATNYQADLARAKERLRASGYTDRSAWAAVWEAERRVAEADGEPWAEALDLGQRWDTGAPLPHVVSGEQVCVLVCHAAVADPAWDGTYVNVVSPSDTQPSPLLVFTFRHFHSITFGGPNDEVMNGHPLSGRGLEPYGAHRIHNSPWLAEEERINSVHPGHRPEAYRRYRHYFFAFHDQTFEALAPDVQVRAVRSTVSEQLREAVTQLTASES